MWLLMLSAAFAQDCPEQAVTGAQLIDSTEEARLAFASLDEAAFSDARSRAQFQTACLTEVLLPNQAAAVHRIEALAAFLKQDELNTIRSYQASLTIEPNYALPTAIAPAGGPLSSLYSAAQNQAPASSVAIPAPSEGALYVNGNRGGTAYEGLPVIVQVVAADGGIKWSGYADSVSALPEFVRNPPVAPAPAPAPEPVEPTPVAAQPMPEPTPAPQPTRGKNGLAYAAIGTGVATIAMFGGSALSRMGYDNTPTASGRATTNALYFGSVGAGVVTVGLGIGAAIRK